MADQRHEGVTDDGEPYVIVRTDATIDAYIGYDAEPSSYTCDTEQEAVEFFDQIVREVSKP
ncbi:hypothetical protein [Dactylosporangium salmoneum]|uniref:Uncharacterized protein n=1 Tax=Dactylosporangium salmoneum TaxID=53361 RepID=A0ABP5T8E0_9ACTN